MIIDNNLKNNVEQNQMGTNPINGYSENLLKDSNFKFELESMISNYGTSSEILNSDTSKMLSELDFDGIYNIDSAKISQNDAMFFVNMLNQNGLVNYKVENNQVELSTKNSNKIEASNALLDMLKSSYDSKKPMRMDFDNNVTVVLKMDDKGKVAAQFFPGDKAVEEYLRNNIPYLRQRFDEQNIAYSNLSYKQHKQEKDEQQNPNEKENK